MKKVILTGDRPTGRLHVGHYVGSLKERVRLQNTGKFDEIYIMTGGGPGRSSEVLGTYLFRTGFRNDEMGYASAIATMVFFVTFVFSVIQMRISGTGRREE